MTQPLRASAEIESQTGSGSYNNKNNHARAAAHVPSLPCFPFCGELMIQRSTTADTAPEFQAVSGIEMYFPDNFKTLVPA